MLLTRISSEYVLFARIVPTGLKSVIVLFKCITWEKLICNCCMMLNRQNDPALFR